MKFVFHEVIYVNHSCCNNASKLKIIDNPYKASNAYNNCSF